MKSMKHVSKSDNAVSPVVGIMLMLVITIIIAAVVAAFAGGFAASQEPVQTSVIKITDYKLGNVSYKWGPSGSTFGNLVMGTGPVEITAPQTSAGIGIYNLSIVHNGGAAYNTADMKLLLTYNGATVAPVKLSDLTDAEKFSAGDKLELHLLKSPISEYDGTSLGYGLLGQSLTEGEYDIPWSLEDANSKVVASGSIKVVYE